MQMSVEYAQYAGDNVHTCTDALPLLHWEAYSPGHILQNYAAAPKIAHAPMLFAEYVDEACRSPPQRLSLAGIIGDEPIRSRSQSLTEFHLSRSPARDSDVLSDMSTTASDCNTSLPIEVSFSTASAASETFLETDSSRASSKGKNKHTTNHNNKTLLPHFERIPVGIEETSGFQVMKRLIGPKGRFIQDICVSSGGAKVWIIGRGSRSWEDDSGPLTVCVGATAKSMIDNAKAKVLLLISRVNDDYSLWLNKQSPAGCKDVQ